MSKDQPDGVREYRECCVSTFDHDRWQMAHVFNLIILPHIVDHLTRVYFEKLEWGEAEPEELRHAFSLLIMIAKSHKNSIFCRKLWDFDFPTLPCVHTWELLSGQLRQLQPIRPSAPPSSDKIRSTRQEIRSVFSENEISKLTVRKFCSLLGKLNSLSGAVVSAQLHLWPLHHLMRHQLARARYQDFMHLNSQVIEEMQWWHDEMHQWSGKARGAECWGK